MLLFLLCYFFSHSLSSVDLWYVEISHGVSFLVDEACAEVAHARPVDNGTAQYVAAFLQPDAVRHSIVAHHAAVSA